MAVTGWIVTLIGIAFLAFVSLSPLGLVPAYTMPPKADVAGPWGMTTPISDINSLYQREGEPRDAYLERLTHEIADGIVHYWHAGEQWDQSDAAYTRPGILDNYLLWAHALHPDYPHFYSYEFMTPRHIIDRGYGFCSQVSKLVWSILREQGISASVINSPGHVVAEVDGNILDADYGVFIPASIDEIHANPGILETYYHEFPTSLQLLKKVYAGEWKPADHTNLAFMYDYEKRMDELKWAPPLLIVGFGMTLLAITGWRGRSRRPLHA
jgi:hypothetical protein